MEITGYEILMLSVTIITMLTGIICSFYAHKSFKKRKRGKPKGIEHISSQSTIKCEITQDNNVTVNMKITAYPQPAKQKKTVIFHK